MITNLTIIIFDPRSFKILPEGRDAALEMRGPVKSVFADMEIHVAARIRECLGDSFRNSTDPKTGMKNGKNRKRRNQNQREEKYKYFWSIEGPNSADLSARNQPGSVDSGAIHKGGLRNFHDFLSPIHIWDY